MLNALGQILIYIVPFLLVLTFIVTIHELGHSCYELAIDPAYNFTPLGHGVSMGVHESQSRIYENQIGRGAAFCEYLFGQMQATFGTLNLKTARDFTRAVNRVHAGFIRTESDECF